MLHLENFFEKSFALLLTTPKKLKKIKKWLTTALQCDIIISVARLVGQGVKTSPSHGENRSSILLQAASSRCGSVW